MLLIINIWQLHVYNTVYIRKVNLEFIECCFTGMKEIVDTEPVLCKKRKTKRRLTQLESGEESDESDEYKATE